MSSCFRLTGRLHSATNNWKLISTHKPPADPPASTGIQLFRAFLTQCHEHRLTLLLSANTLLFQDGKQTEVGYVQHWSLTSISHQEEKEFNFSTFILTWFLIKHFQNILYSSSHSELHYISINVICWDGVPRCLCTKMYNMYSHCRYKLCEAESRTHNSCQGSENISTNKTKAWNCTVVLPGHVITL